MDGEYNTNELRQQYDDINIVQFVKFQKFR